MLLLDEPTTALDIGHQQEVLELVDRLAPRRGLTVVTTMHDLTLAAQYADRLVLLAGGRSSRPRARPRRCSPREHLARHYGAKVRMRPTTGGRLVVIPVPVDDPRPERGPVTRRDTGRPSPHRRPRAPDGLPAGPSLVLVNTGDGKGKTTAAFGVVLRARRPGLAGRRRAVPQVGDVADRRGEDLPASSASTGGPSARASPGTPTTSPRTRPSRRRRGPTPRALIEAGEHRLVVLDEITYPMNWGWIDIDEVVATIRDRPAAGQRRSSPAATRPPALIEIADTVTEMRKVKHAYDAGIRAKKGIDY